MQLIIHASAPWATFHRRPLIEALAETGGSRVDILVIDRPMDLVVAPIRRRDALWHWLRDPSSRLVSVRENLRVLRPFLPVHEHLAALLPFLPAWQERLLQAQIDRVVPPSGRRVEWIYYPEQQGHLRAREEAFAVYECYDDYAAAPNASPWHRQHEDRLFQRVDLVITTAQTLWEACRLRHPDVHLVPNGVDYATLAPAQEQGPLHPVLAEIPEPRIGFLGYLNSAVDAELLESLAASRPDWSWVFIGPPDGADPRALQRIRALPNVHFLGFVPRSQLVPALRGLRVGIIPFKVEGSYHQAINPLKLYEYMAAGLPVISTELPEVVRFAPPVRLASTASAFQEEIGKLLADREAWQEARAQGDRLARTENWNARAEACLALLDTRLGREPRGMPGR